MYLLQKIVGAFTEPLILALALCVIAAFVRRLWPRAFKWVLVLAGSLVYVSSIEPVATGLLGPLERKHPPSGELDADSVIQHVVVLGSGYSPYAGRPITSALDEEGLVRIVEGVRLQRQWNIPNMIVSGGAPQGRGAPAVGYAELARSLGVDPAALTVHDKPLDTAQEAREVAAALGSKPFLLVTSAYHMPRAVLLMERAGARPVPAPTGHRVAPEPELSLRGLLPTTRSLRRTEKALHEYVAMLALTMGIE